MTTNPAPYGRKQNDPLDFYETPVLATEALMSVETFTGKIYEPCSGHGAISKVLETKYEVISSDIRADGYGTPNTNALLSTNRMDNLVTNPPYNQALEIVQHSLDFVDGKACFLLKLVFLEGQKRKPFFEKNPPSRVWVFSKRIAMYPKGFEGSGSGTIAYAWFVWDKNSTDQGKLGWL